MYIGMLYTCWPTNPYAGSTAFDGQQDIIRGKTDMDMGKLGIYISYEQPFTDNKLQFSFAISCLNQR